MYLRNNNDVFLLGRWVGDDGLIFWVCDLAAVEPSIQGFECSAITAAVLTSDSEETTREAEGLNLRQFDWDSLEKKLVQFGIGARTGLERKLGVSNSVFPEKIFFRGKKNRQSEGLSAKRQLVAPDQSGRGTGRELWSGASDSIGPASGKGRV